MEAKRSGYEDLLKYQKYLQKLNYDYSETDKLFELYKSSTGEEKIKIRNKIIEINLLLIINFLIKKYDYSYDKNPVFDIDDIVQEASIVIIKAIDSYNKTKGKFSTYVYFNLKNRIYYINGIPNSPIRFKISNSSQFKKIKKYIDQGYDDQFIIEKFGISESLLKRIKPFLMNPASYEELLLSNKIEDFIQEKNDQTAELYINQLLEEDNIEVRNKEIMKALNKLKERDKLLIIKFFGLDGNEPYKKMMDLNKEFGYKANYIHKRYKYIISKLSKNESLREAYYLVNSDYDHNTHDKTYYLQK